MKRFMSVIFGIILCLLFLTSATAENSKTDISGMSTEALLSLQTEITAQLYANNQLVSLPAGEYVAGRDIAAGSYVITFLKNRWDWADITITVYISPDARAKYESACKDYQLRWTLIREAIEKNSNIQISEPEILDASQYYITNIDEHIDVGASFRVSISDGQMLYIDYKADNAFVVIEQSPGLFMQ